MRLNDFEEEDITKIKPRKKAVKKAVDRGGHTAFLTLIIGLLLGALIMMLIVYYTEPIRVDKKVDSEIITIGDKGDKSVQTQNENELGEDEVKIEENALSKEESLIKEDETENSEELSDDALIIQSLKESLTNGEPTYKALRKSFKNELVCARDGRFYFSDIEPYINKNEYMADNLSEKDNGRLEYIFDDGSKARTGVDVSKYQGEVDWEAVKADGIDFAIIRAGIRGYESGKLVMDEDFAKNITQAIDAGLDVGIYFFSQAVTTDEAVEEAEAVIEAIDNNPLSYPFVYDLEYIKDGRRSSLDRSQITDIARAFCERAQESGYQPMIYGNLDTFLLQLELSRVEDIPKWLAYYDNDFYYPYQYDIWQYTDKGVVDGIGEEVDLNLDFRH